MLIQLCKDTGLIKTDFSVDTDFSDQGQSKDNSDITKLTNEPRCEKTGLRGFRPGPTQTRLCSHRRWLEAWNFGFSKQRDCTICVAKTKALISFVVTAKLICVFVSAYAKSRFSHNEAKIQVLWPNYNKLCLCCLEIWIV